MIKVKTFDKNPRWECRLERQTLLYSVTSDIKGLAGYAVDEGKMTILIGKIAIIMDLQDAEIMAEELKGICEDATFRKDLGLELQPNDIAREVSQCEE